MRSTAMSILGGCVLLLTACGDGETNANSPDDEPIAGDAATDGAEETSADADGSASSDTAATEQSEDASGSTDTAGDVVGSYSVDGTTYEVTKVLDCSIGSEGFPDDRQFVGESSDGAVQMTVSYFENETLSGLNGAGLAIEVRDGTVAEITWASSYAGADATFEITPRADGADGTAEVGAVGPDVPEGEFIATWSFTC